MNSPTRLPLSAHYSVQQAIKEAQAREGELSDIVILGTYKTGEAFAVSSNLKRKDVLYILETEKLYAMGVLEE